MGSTESKCGCGMLHNWKHQWSSRSVPLLQRARPQQSSNSPAEEETERGQTSSNASASRNDSEAWVWWLYRLEFKEQLYSNKDNPGYNLYPLCLLILLSVHHLTTHATSSTQNFVQCSMFTCQPFHLKCDSLALRSEIQFHAIVWLLMNFSPLPRKKTSFCSLVRLIPANKWGIF